MAMSTMESLNYAQGRLAMARAMCDHSEIENWRKHVEYWQSKLAAEEADRANEEVCKTCNGIKYIAATKSTPDKQCPECKGRGLTQRAPDVCPQFADGEHIWSETKVGLICVACGKRR